MNFCSQLLFPNVAQRKIGFSRNVSCRLIFLSWSTQTIDVNKKKNVPRINKCNVGHASLQTSSYAADKHNISNDTLAKLVKLLRKSENNTCLTGGTNWRLSLSPTLTVWHSIQSWTAQMSLLCNQTIQYLNKGVFFSGVFVWVRTSTKLKDEWTSEWWHGVLYQWN